MKIKIILFIGAIITASLFSCERDTFNTDADAVLAFSTDTLMFDTVFTSIGSVTRSFKVGNLNKGTVNIDRLRLKKGDASNYRLNVNGMPGNYFENIEIDEKDSIYIFAEVTVDPNRDEMIEEDAVQFYINGNLQEVQLVAFGQDVHLINDSIIASQTWGNDKPYLIYNSVAVNENEELRLEAGAHLYFHRNSQMIVLGTLTSEGTADEPVIIEGDRLEDMYFDVPGQWEGIWLTKISHDNYLNYTQIYGANYGIWVDSVQNENPMLVINNSIISHHTLFGLHAVMSHVVAYNSEFSDCGYNNIKLSRGGDYEFYHCTVSNYFSHAVRRDAAICLNNYLKYEDVVYLSQLDNAYFANCIIWGNKETELNIDLYNEGVENNYKFDNCILKIDSKSGIDTDDTEHYTANIINTDPKFKDYFEYDFSLDTLSVAKDAANPAIINKLPDFLNFDMYGTNRLNDSGPDIGAYERLE